MPSIVTAPQNSLVMVTEAPTATGPTDFQRGAGFAATRSCIGVCCLMYQDGKTKITLAQPLTTSERPAFDGFLDTPRRKVAVWTIAWEKLLETGVATTRTRIRIWTNHPTEPDDVYIGVGE